MNRLAAETSPYLRQHADNPVDWYPWGDEAFARAKETDRPIFLSIGQFRLCHWCHVMAHESFENADTAATLNRSFVSIKVDREERPDVDAVYMEAVQAMIGSGGWPMSMFLTPDGRPFFGGTYFPPHDRQGSPSFTTVLNALTDVWTDRRDEVERQADELSRAVAERSVIRRPTGSGAEATTGPVAGGNTELLDAAVTELAERFDAEWGGFGPAPKFPHPTFDPEARRRSDTRARPVRPCPARWPPPRSTPWPPAASTITSEVASPATRPTISGSCPTSRRCSTTRPGCFGRTSTGGR